MVEVLINPAIDNLIKGMVAQGIRLGATPNPPIAIRKWCKKTFKEVDYV